MTILLIGGTGTTGSALAHLLHDNGHPVLVASRKGQSGVSSPLKGVQFDWLDKSTWKNVFSSEIKAVYLIAPSVQSSETYLIPFIDLCITNGVKRIVLLSASAIEKGGPEFGKAHEYLEDKVKVEWCVLRPSWFFENFLGDKRQTILQSDNFISATEDGKMGVVSGQDIAAAAYAALTDEISHNTDHILVGPELLSYDEIAEQLSDVVGRKITHKRITPKEFEEYARRYGEAYAALLTEKEVGIAHGDEERVWASPKAVRGKYRIKDFFKDHKELFLK